VRLVPLFHGGGQERGLRSGTLPTPLCVGFGAAAAIAAAEMAAESTRLAGLGHRSWPAFAPPCRSTLQGSAERRVPGNLNIAFPGIDADALLAALPELSLSTGSACSSGRGRAVLRHRRAWPRRGGGARRGAHRPRPLHDGAEVDFAVERLVEAVRALRRDSAP